jgi:phosphonate transport system substrate-binding protein
MRKILGIIPLLAGLAATASAVPSDWPDKLVFSTVPTESSSNQTERFKNLVDYLTSRLGIPVQMISSSDYAGVITGMQFKHVDFAYFGPKSYAEASERAGAQCFVVEVDQDGMAGYHGVIITNKASGIHSIAEAKGKVWAFTDPNSTSGTLVPTLHLVKDLKIDPQTYFSKVIYSGSHEASMLAIKAGKVDIASTNDLDMLRGEGKMWNKDKDFDIVWISPLIPGSPIAYRKDLPATLKNALQDAFVNYKDKDGLAMLKLSGYAPVADSVYDPVRAQIAFKREMDKK